MLTIHEKLKGSATGNSANQLTIVYNIDVKATDTRPMIKGSFDWI